MNKPYLSAEEQYKEILNNEEIERIQDTELQEIRRKYWNLRHKAALDEAHISDQELGRVLDDLKAKEQAEKPSCGCTVKKTVESKSIRLDKKVIGRVDIAKNARYQTIVVGSDALVTGLASDEAYNRGITIVRE